MNTILMWRNAVVIVFLLSIASTHARMGEEPTIDDLVTRADVVCVARMAGYDTVPVVGTNTTMWFAERFVVDHKIKGSFQSNIFMILVRKIEQPEKAKEIVAQQSGEGIGSRYLLFLKETDRKMSQFKLVDEMDGMIRVGSTAPAIEEKAVTRKRIEVEMSHGVKQLDANQREQLRTILDKWLRETNAVPKRL